MSYGAIIIVLVATEAAHNLRTLTTHRRWSRRIRADETKIVQAHSFIHPLLQLVSIDRDLALTKVWHLGLFSSFLLVLFRGWIERSEPEIERDGHPIESVFLLFRDERSLSFDCSSACFLGSDKLGSLSLFSKLTAWVEEEHGVDEED